MPLHGKSTCKMADSPLGRSGDRGAVSPGEAFGGQCLCLQFQLSSVAESLEATPRQGFTLSQNSRAMPWPVLVFLVAVIRGKYTYFSHFQRLVQDQSTSRLSCVMMTSTYTRDENCVLTERREEGQAGGTLKDTSSMGRSPLTRGNLLDLGDG